MTKRIMVIFGTRPECIKIAPVIAALYARPTDFEVTVCSTGQHDEMLSQAMACFKIRPDIDLSVMRANQTLSQLTAALMATLPSAIGQVRPDWVVVQGDTATTFTAALAAFYEHIPIAHIEAGLRSGDNFNPFPEEINRRLVSSLSHLHFAPTLRAVEALRREGVPNEHIHLTGNTIVDALFMVRAESDAQGGVSSIVRGFAANKVVLVTCHRREALGKDLAAICRAIRRLAVRYPDNLFVFLLHLNPVVQTVPRNLLGDIPNVRLMDPLPYREVIFLLSQARLVLSDSGGLQEEAPSFGVSVLVLRRKTERPEGIEVGFAELIGVDEEVIVKRASERIEAEETMRCGPNPYGDGRAAQRIADILARVS
jgi:UDP-N-acetylglucosamine 2-epimerase (non-hydrolysing)